MEYQFLVKGCFEYGWIKFFLERSLSSLFQPAVVIEEFLAFMVLLNYIIPISMYVTVGEYSHVVIVSCRFKWRRLMNKKNQYLVGTSHRF